MGALSRFAGSTCLVTGGLGFIGSNVALSLDLACIDIGGFSGDYTKAHQSLKWIPQVSFSDGVDQTLDFTGGIRGTSD